MNKKRFWFIGICMLLFLVVVGFITWAETPLPPMPEAIRAMQSDTQVQVITKPWLVFQPASLEQDTGFIFYPGGRVDARAYAPAARAIAEQGYLVVIVPMPLNLAVFGVYRANEVIRAFPFIHRWGIGGHSLGGAMAASFAYQHSSSVKGLVLWASYPASSNDLSKMDLKVTSIYATLDGLSTSLKIDTSRPFLPSGTHWVVIEGGNHGQFGWYGSQPGDNEVVISRQEQQNQVIKATVFFLADLNSD
jgi:hypothetical protein